MTAALAALPARQRRAVELVYLEGMTHAEAAAALGWSRGSVGKYVERGLARLRRKLDRAGLAVAGGLAVEAALTAAPPAAAERAAALADGLAARAVTIPDAAAWLTGKKLAAGLGLVVGVTAGGVAWWPGPAPPPPAPVPARAETVPERNLRVFHAEIAPAVAAALLPAAIGGGPVEVERAEAFDARVDATFAVRHRLPAGPGWASRVRFVRDAAGGRTLVLVDLAGSGRWERFLQPEAGRPTVVLRSSWLGLRLDLPVESLAAAVRAFDRLPRDARTATAGAAFRARLAAALAPHLGVWHHKGDPAEPWRLEWADGRPRFAAPAGGRWSWADGRTWMAVEPDGPVGGGLLFEDEPAEFSGDGRRLTFGRTGEWWDRAADPPR